MTTKTTACIIALTGLALASITLPAAASPKIKLGTLTCQGGEGVGLILGSKKYYDCHFTPANNGPGDVYEGSVTKIGLDIGVTGKTTILWTVLAAEAPHRHHALAGTYVGVNADASLGLGAGAKVLVGGSNKSITLQPLSVQGQTGVNLALGIAGFKLR